MCMGEGIQAHRPSHLVHLDVAWGLLEREGVCLARRELASRLQNLSRLVLSELSRNGWHKQLKHPVLYGFAGCAVSKTPNGRRSCTGEHYSTNAISRFAF
jgi:hypothetical protein